MTVVGWVRMQINRGYKEILAKEVEAALDEQEGHIAELEKHKKAVKDAMKEIEETERLYGLEGVEAIAILNHHLDKLTEEEQKP